VQTFLPYPGFAESAAVIDDRRLGKQRVETFQVLRAIVWPTYGWKNHPAVVMWRGFVPALVAYGVAVCDEWTARGRADATREQLLEFSGGREHTWAELLDQGQLPPWIGSEPVHLSHRSALLRKDAEYYRDVFPDVPDDLPYVWPGSVFPRWPVRRGTSRPLDLDAAARACGLPEPTDEQRRTVYALLDGPELVVSTREGPLTGLVAALCLPGATAWLRPDARPHPGPQVPHREPVQASGSTSASIARPPGQVERRAMKEEAAAEPELRFLRADQLGPTPPPGVGLVVADGLTPPSGWRLPTLVLDAA
jgi:hypothetical protein